MKKGCLITNEFLQTDKFNELTEWFLLTAKKMGVPFEHWTNASFSNVYLGETCPFDFVLFWDKDIILANYLESQGIPCYNSSSAIDICDNKIKTWLALTKHNIKTPKTIPAPMTYDNVGYTNIDFITEIENAFGYPMVVKEAYGSFGAQVYLPKNREELNQIISSKSDKKLLFQEFVQKSSGRDVRLQVVGSRVVAAMYRYSDIDFRANVTNGGKMKAYEPTIEEQTLAIAACKAVGAHFAGVDLLFGKEQERYVCEVNSNAHFKNIYDCTGVDVAEEILKEICSDGGRHL